LETHARKNSIGFFLGNILKNMPTRKQQVIPTEEEEEILNSGDDDSGDEEDDMDFMDMGGLLSSLLTTEDGDNVTTALMKMSLMLQEQIKTQNKILVKILSALEGKIPSEKVT
jgi:hypothetical protein